MQMGGKEQSEEKHEVNRRTLLVDAPAPPVWYRFIFQALVPEWLPCWAHLHRNLYVRFSNWVHALKSVHLVTDTDTVLCQLSQIIYNEAPSTIKCDTILMTTGLSIGLGVEERSQCFVALFHFFYFSLSFIRSLFSASIAFLLPICSSALAFTFLCSAVFLSSPDSVHLMFVNYFLICCHSVITFPST